MQPESTGGTVGCFKCDPNRKGALLLDLCRAIKFQYGCVAESLRCGSKPKGKWVRSFVDHYDAIEIQRRRYWVFTMQRVRLLDLGGAIKILMGKLKNLCDAAQIRRVHSL